ncbi:caspase family protein [Stieleria varia]|uniref:Caspase domain protein n=1 Tax=Stieleria varia TaxID=2528005 RepID=A0A5C6A5D8_9BACT|nr:caspase family protein [Stieleria varia]TWT94699.1 Caspase domain protein [Stieleria varia]
MDQKRVFGRARLATKASAAFGVWLATVTLAAGTLAAGETWALLIGVQDYQQVSPLEYTVDDAQCLRETLIAYGGVAPDHILEITDFGPGPDSQPLHETLTRRIPAWLERVGADDMVLVFFSGHGFRDDDGLMYLAPLDFDRTKPSETGISVDWLRERIAGCSAVLKLLILDACHAGSENSEPNTDSLSPDEMGRLFKAVDGVVTLASCSEDQVSVIWQDKRRSLYSYWLTEGLKGHADRDSNGSVDIDELHSYVSRRVAHTAKVRFPNRQTPVRIVGPRVIGVPDVVRLKPQPLRPLLANMAEHVADLLDEHKYRRAGVLEFTDDSRLQEVLGGQFGLVGKFCGDELERQLISASQDASFRIVNRDQLRHAILQDGGFEVSAISSTPRLRSLSKSVGDMPAVAMGSIKGRQGAFLRLQVELKETTTGDVIGITGGTAALSENDWAMLGYSVVIRPEDRQRVLTSINRSSESETEQVITAADRRSQGAHALLDPEFKSRFDVEIRVNGTVRPPVFRGNDCFVGVKKGDRYAIRLHNKSGTVALARILVDGLDTGMKVAESDNDIDVWGQPITHLNDAVPRLLDPNGPEVAGKIPKWDLLGFMTKSGVGGQVREFTVVNAAESLANQRGYSDQIGLITVAFYAPKADSRALGTAAGQTLDRNIRTYKGIKPGNLLGVVHIRYVDADLL